MSTFTFDQLALDNSIDDKQSKKANTLAFKVLLWAWGAMPSCLSLSGASHAVAQSTGYSQASSSCYFLLPFLQVSSWHFLDDCFWSFLLSLAATFDGVEGEVVVEVEVKKVCRADDGGVKPVAGSAMATWVDSKWSHYMRPGINKKRRYLQQGLHRCTLICSTRVRKP